MVQKEPVIVERAKKERVYCSPTHSGWRGTLVKRTYSLQAGDIKYSVSEILPEQTSFRTTLKSASKAPV